MHLLFNLESVKRKINEKRNVCVEVFNKIKSNYVCKVHKMRAFQVHSNYKSHHHRFMKLEESHACLKYTFIMKWNKKMSLALTLVCSYVYNNNSVFKTNFRSIFSMSFSNRTNCVNGKFVLILLEVWPNFQIYLKANISWN